jgi:hypothetical protein
VSEKWGQKGVGVEGGGGECVRGLMRKFGGKNREEGMRWRGWGK